MKAYISLFLVFTLSFTGFSSEEDNNFINLKGSPVIGLFEDTLFEIYTKEGSFSIEERANAITNRISKISQEPFFNKENLKLFKVNDEIEILYNELVILNVSTEDSRILNKPQEKLAEGYRLIIEKEISNYHNETSFIIVAKEIGLAILTIGIVIILLFFNKKLY